MERKPLPREAVIDRVQLMVNGPTPDRDRFGYLDRARAAETLDVMKANLILPMEKVADFEYRTPEGEDLVKLQKNVTQATGLTYYDLRGPALNLFPTYTPLRNAIPRNSRANPGDALHYKTILATTGSGFPFMGWVPEGHRSASMSYTANPVTLPYATLGEEDSLTDEAKWAAQGFEDENALVQLRLLLKMFVKEEAAILGGNATMTLSAPGTITSTATGTAYTLPALTYSIYCVALTQEGYRNSSVANGVATAMTIVGNDGSSYVLNGGSSAPSAQKTQGITLGQLLTVSVSPIRGAVAYAWFVGAAGSETLQSITTTAQATFGAPLGTGAQAITAVVGDHSSNPNVAFDGLLTTAFKAGNNAYYNALANGSTLTASGKGSVVEIDNMLLSMWNNYLLSPTVIYVNAQQLGDITTKVLSNSTSPLLRYNVAADQDGMVEYKLTAGGVIAYYFNPYAADGGTKIPVKIHPNLAPGTIIAWCEKLPPQYVSNETPTVAEMMLRQDYMNEVWPRTNRVQYYGIYESAALAVYAPFAMGCISNITAG